MLFSSLGLCFPGPMLFSRELSLSELVLGSTMGFVIWRPPVYTGLLRNKSVDGYAVSSPPFFNNYKFFSNFLCYSLIFFIKILTTVL